MIIKPHHYNAAGTNTVFVVSEVSAKKGKAI